MNAGLLLVRLILGAAYFAHGTQKLFGWFGGYGLDGTGGYMESLGFRPGKRYALGAGLCEAGGGLLLALGFLGPVGPALIVVAMAVAIVTVHWKNGFFATANGVELPLFGATGAMAIAFAGPGAFSLDFVLGLELSAPAVAWIALVAALLIAGATLATRRHAPVAHAST
jgi:putative oxidoreductase